jgi:hypothetical protein
MRGHSGSTPSIARLARNACGVAARFRRELACVHGTLVVGDMLALRVATLFAFPALRALAFDVCRGGGEI